MTHFKILLLGFFVLWYHVSFCQDTAISHGPILISSKKTKSLHKFSDVEFVYYLKDNKGEDSITYTVKAYSKEIKADTLFIGLENMDEYRKHSPPQKPYSIFSYYSYEPKTTIKVPLSQISKVTGKRYSLRFVTGSIAFFSAIGILSAAPIALFSQSKNKEKLFYQVAGIAAGTLAVSLTINYTLGKKVFHIDPKKNSKRIWMLK